MECASAPFKLQRASFLEVYEPRTISSLLCRPTVDRATGVRRIAL